MTGRAAAMSLANDDAEEASTSTLAFDEVYDRWLDFVWRSLRRLGVPQASLDDAVQDVFVVVHRRLSTFEGRSTLKTWLFGIALRVARDQRRSASRRGRAEPLSGDLRDWGEGPFEALSHKRALEALDAMLGRLDEDKRVVFVMMDIEEMTAGEAAEVLGIKPNTAYSRLRLARAELESMAGERGDGR